MLSFVSRKLIVRPSTISRPTVVPPSISIPGVRNDQDTSDVNKASTDEAAASRRPPLTRPRPPSVFPPKITRPSSKDDNTFDPTVRPPFRGQSDEDKVQIAGILPPLLPTSGKRPRVKEEGKDRLSEDDEVKRKETVIGNDNINPAIVEGIPGIFSLFFGRAELSELRHS